METEMDLFRITLGLPPIISDVHELGNEISKIIIYSKVATTVSISKHFSKTEIESKVYEISPGTNILCVCHVRKVSQYKNSIVNIYVSVDKSNEVNRTAHLVRHTTEFGYRSLFSFQFSPLNDSDLKIIERFMPHYEPTDIDMKFFNNTLTFHQVTDKMHFSKLQIFILLIGNQGICRDIFSHNGHELMLTAREQAIYIPSKRVRKVIISLKDFEYADLFGSKNSPRIVHNKKRQQRDIVHSDIEMTDNDHIQKYSLR